MQRLLDIGFERVGYWYLKDNKISFDVTTSEKTNILYAYIIGSEVMYVGKSSRTLKARLGNYKNPESSQKTNMRVNGYIKDSLMAGKQVTIYEYSKDSDLRIGDFKVDISAGLEESIIKVINPKWNYKACLRFFSKSYLEYQIISVDMHGSNPN